MKSAHSEDKIKNGIFGAMMQAGFISVYSYYEAETLNIGSIPCEHLLKNK